MLQRTRRDGQAFQIRVSLWLTRQLADLGIPVEVDPLCTALRRGWRNDKQLSEVVLTKVRECLDLDQAFKALIAGDVANGAVQLTVVFER